MLPSRCGPRRFSTGRGGGACVLFGPQGTLGGEHRSEHSTDWFAHVPVARCPVDARSFQVLCCRVGRDRSRPNCWRPRCDPGFSPKQETQRKARAYTLTKAVCWSQSGDAAGCDTHVSRVRASLASACLRVSICRGVEPSHSLGGGKATGTWFHAADTGVVAASPQHGVCRRRRGSPSHRYCTACASEYL